MKLAISLSRFVALGIKCFVVLSITVNTAIGETQQFAPCPSVDATYLGVPSQSVQLSLTVKQNNLVIQEHLSANQFKIHQVTFSRQDAANQHLSEACEITPLALTQGGDWGWHVLWQTADGVFYARVDGTAWVPSLPRRIIKQPAFDVSMTVDKEIITVRWKDSANSSQKQSIVSVNEGRSWD